MSNLLSQASLVMIPSGYKEDVVYSAVPTNGNGDLSFTRASNGTRVNSAGLVEVTPWNFNTNSENFTSGWGTDGTSTATNNFTTAPNGTTTAAKVVANSAGGYAYKAFSGSPNVYTLSLYVKASANTTIDLAINDVGGSGIGTQNFNVTTEWQRIEYDQNVTLGSSVFIVYGSLNTGVNYFVWGAQVNIGATAKPYFPTTDRLNVPRLTYQNGGGGCPSLLLEKQSTNLYPYSEDLTQWLTSGSPTVTGNDSISPDGTTNADRVQFSASGNLVYNNGTGSAGTNTLTVYAKAKSGTAQKFRFFANGATTVSSDFTATDQWQRFEYSYTFSAVTAGLQGASTGASDVLFWGFQHEVSSYATSYIGPTTSSSATRVADECSKTGISSLIGQTEGVLFLDVDLTHNNSGSNEYLAQIRQDSSNRILLYRSSSNSSIGVVVLNAGGTIFSNLSSVTGNTKHKVAIAYKSGDLAFYIDGVQIATNSTTFSAYSSLSAFDLGNNSVGGTPVELGDYNYNQAILFPTRLTNAELASLTTL